jgi:hypothetical protein
VPVAPAVPAALPAGPALPEDAAAAHPDSTATVAAAPIHRASRLMP